MRSFSVLFLFGVGCTTTPTRDLTVVGSVEEPPGEVWTPSGGSETGAPDGGQDTAAGGGSGASDWAGSPCSVAKETAGALWLPVDGCVRVTPEPENAGTSTDGGQEAVPPPCGFYNLLGSVSLAGSAQTPTALYCDSDGDGGVRFAQYDGGTERIHSTLLEARMCWIGASTGALLAWEDGWLAWWISYGARESTGIDLVGTRLDAGGTPVLSQTTSLSLSAAAVLPVAGAVPLLLVVDGDGTLWSAPVDTATGGLRTAPVALESHVSALDAVPLSSGAVLALCDGQDDLVLMTVDADGVPVDVQAVVESTCDLQTRPSLAGGDAGLALAWHTDDGDRAHLALLDADGRLRVQVDLGEGAPFPQVQPVPGGGWLTVDGRGAVQRIDDQGAVVGQWMHPHIPDVGFDLLGLRMRLSSETAPGQVVIERWARELEIQGPHAYTFNYLELSTFPVPAL